MGLGAAGAHLAHLVDGLGPHDIPEELKAKLLQLERGQVADHCGETGHGPGEQDAGAPPGRSIPGEAPGAKGPTAAANRAKGARLPRAPVKMTA